MLPGIEVAINHYPLRTVASFQLHGPSLGQLQRRLAGETICNVIEPIPPTHWHRNRAGQLKTWLIMLTMDLARMSGPNVLGLRRWNREWLSLGITWTQDRQSWAAAIRDVVDAMDTGTTSPG